MSESGQKREAEKQTGSSKKRRTRHSCSADCPVLVVHSEPKDSPPISLCPELDDLLYPLTGKDFMESFFREKAVHITCRKGKETDHAEQRVSGLSQEMFGLDPEMILRESSSESIFLWLQGKENKNTNGKADGKLIRSIEVADVETAICLHKIAKHATYCRAPPNVEQSLVASLLRATGLGCGQYDPSGESLTSMGRGEVETFISTDGHLTNWHYDFQENFTIQLSGVKRWTLQQGTIKDPIRGCTPHYAAPEAVESQLKAAYLFDRKFRFGFPQSDISAKGNPVSIDVKPGDVLYFPAGMWHKVETVEPGVSINVSLMASSYAVVTCQALQHYLFKDKRWRAPVLNHGKTSAVDSLKLLLKDLPSMIQELERSGGAGAILPPITTFPPRFEGVGKGHDWENLSKDESSTCSTSDGNREEDSGLVAETEVDGLSEYKDAVLDPADFDDYPGDWSLNVEVGTKIKITKNPLAALHRLEEITSFYKPEAGKETDNTFVLNINYAGNEMHHSVVRVLFRDSDEAFVQMLYDKERANEHVSIDTVLSETNLSLFKFLTFYGYMKISSGQQA